MTKLSFLEKLKIFFSISKSSKLFLAIIVFLIFFAYLLITTNKKNQKTTKNLFILIYTFIFLFIIIAYHSSLGKMFDYLMNNVFIVFYFPNLAIYLVAIIVMNIILLVSIFNYKTTKFIKNINIVVYCLLNYLLALILNVITTEKLDIYTVQSVYGNKNTLGLIELSSTIFVVWIIFLIIYKIFLAYLHRKNKKVVKKVLVKRKFLPENIVETTLPRSVKKVSSKNILENSLLKNTNENTKELENMLTLNDYKILLNILNENKKKTNSTTSLENKINLAINKKDFYEEPEIIETKNVLVNNYQEQTKIEKEILEKKEQSIFEELKELYKID